MRKLINNPTNVVREMLEGLVDLNHNLAIMDSENIIIRADICGSNSEVAVISGGGSGHEPAHAGYVGHGMLHAAVVGDVFTSPSTASILAAIRASSGSKGALLIVTNYTGDRLNFGLAAELARAENIPVETVIVADDVALRDTLEANRSRGIAGTVFINKIAGAAAASGACLEDVRLAAQDAVENIASMGVALGSCIIPAVGKAGFELPDGEIELGLGLHGEKGIKRIKHKSANELVEIILDKILQTLAIQEHESVALLINGLGGTPLMELAIVSRHAISVLRAKGIVVERAWSGNFMTSLEMPGFSLSLMRLNAERLAKLDYPVNSLSWIGEGKIPTLRKVVATPSTKAYFPREYSKLSPQIHLRQICLRVAAALESAETVLTELDSAAGDGDLGMSMCRGAVAIRNLPQTAWLNEVTMLNSMAEVLGNAIAGTSGPFYATALLRAARYFSTKEDVNAEVLAEGFMLAVDAVSQLGGAKLNDRTMIDALYPAAQAFKLAVEQGLVVDIALTHAIHAAEDGVNKTAQMLPKLGRASYLGERALGVKDAGAMAVLIWLKAIAGAS